MLIFVFKSDFGCSDFLLWDLNWGKCWFLLRVGLLFQLFPQLLIHKPSCSSTLNFVQVILYSSHLRFLPSFNEIDRKVPLHRVGTISSLKFQTYEYFKITSDVLLQMTEKHFIRALLCSPLVVSD